MNSYGTSTRLRTKYSSSKKGKLLIKLRDKDVWLEEGEFIIIPKGVEHKPVADQEVHVVLIEPKSTLNTGNVKNEKTLAQLKRI